MSRRSRIRNRRARAVHRNRIRADRALASQTIRADRVTFRDWIRAVLHKRLRVIVAHPHHYATAAGLSVFLVATGHGEAGGIIAAFGYAIVENVCSAADDK